MSTADSQRYEPLVTAATRVRDFAYAPYSDFRVGAAILLEDGQIVSGCNIENVSFSLTVCAERVAASTAVAAGHRAWVAIAVASVGGVTPCGPCRQFLTEFQPNLKVVCVDVRDGSRKSYELSQLLPHAFGASSLSRWEK